MKDAAEKIGWMVAGFVILAWGVTFVNTQVLLQDFSALEIQLLRFGIAWGVLKAASVVRGRSAAEKFGWKDETLFAGMGLSGV